MAPKTSAREQKKNDKDADAVTAGFQLVLDEAMETELAYVTNQLRQKPAIMYTLASLLKSDSLQALLDGKTTKALTSAVPVAKIVAIRKASKKFKHLSDQPTVLTDILKTLEPGWFTTGAQGAEHIHTRTLTSVSESVYPYHRRQHRYYMSASVSSVSVSVSSVSAIHWISRPPQSPRNH